MTRAEPDAPASRQELVTDLARALTTAIDAEARCRGVMIDTTLGQRWASAVAAAETDPAQQAAAALGEALGTEPWLRLVSFDADSIGAYVFESTRPPVIQGASAILDRLNRELSTDLHRRDENGTGGVIYSGGGSGLLVHARSAGFDGVASHIADRFAKATGGGLRVSTVAREVTTADLLPDPAARDSMEHPPIDRARAGLPRTMALLAEDLRAAKASRTNLDTILPGPDEELCSSCFDRVPTTIDRVADREMEVCEVCRIRLEVGRDQIKGLDFQALAGRSTAERRSLGLIALDGNAVGELLGAMQSLLQLRAFSVETGRIYQAARELARCSIARRNDTPHEDAACLSLLAGGDEVVMILPGDLAMCTGLQLVDSIEAGYRESADHGLLGEVFDSDLSRRLSRNTVGVGIVLAPAKTPMRQLYSMALALQRNAKAVHYYGRPAGAGSSGIDFHCMTGSGTLPVAPDLMREMQSRAEGSLRFDQRPYTSSGLAALHERSESCRTVVARSQVYHLRAALADGVRPFVAYQVARDAGGLRAWLTGQGVDTTRRRGIEEWFFERTADGVRTWLDDLLDLMQWSRGSTGPATVGDEG